MSISEQQNYYLEKVKQRNEKILEISGKPFAATANPPDPGLTTVEKARLSAERQLRELSNQHPRSRKDKDILDRGFKATARERHQQEHPLRQGWQLHRSMAATLTDPLVIGTISFGASTSAGILKLRCLKLAPGCSQRR